MAIHALLSGFDAQAVVALVFHMALQAGLVLLHVHIVKLVATVAFAAGRVHAGGRFSGGANKTGKMKRMWIGAGRNSHPVSHADRGAGMASIAVHFAAIFSSFDSSRAGVNSRKRTRVRESISNFAVKKQ